MSTFLGVGRSARGDEERSLRATLRLWCLSAVVLTTLSLGSLLLFLVAVLTLFQFRRMYLALSTWIGRAVLALWGVRLEVVGALPFPRTQTVYVSNHTSSVDMFVLIALGMPGTRFFLSGFLRKILPIGLIGYVTGIFWTVPQEYPEARKRIFAGAAATLKRTGESVYLSPEGMRVTTGELGAFNRGAFHMATDLQAPIVPFYIEVPPDVDPGLGLDVRPGTVTVEVLPTIDTGCWTVEALDEQRAAVFDALNAVHQRRKTSRQRSRA